MSEIVRFRSFQEVDAETLPRLFMQAMQTVYPDLDDGPWLDGLRDVRKNYLDDGGEFIVGEYGSDIVAMGGVKRLSGTLGELVRVAVRPDRHGNGLGQRLLDVLESRAMELGLSELILDTTAGQIAAQKLYEKNGYALTARGRTSHIAGHTFDTLYYAKDLNESS
jgi:GNAT superfamily N-acetyltransferase